MRIQDTKMKNTIMDLRRILDGVTWERFPVYDGVLKPRYLTLEGVKFYVKYGLHLQRPTLAIIARRQFISFTYVKLDQVRSVIDGQQVILPNAKYEFGGQHLFDADFAPHRSALIKLDGEKLRRDEPMIRELCQCE